MLEFLELLLDPLLDGIVGRHVVGIIVLVLLVYGTSFVLTGSILPTLFGLLTSLLLGWGISPRPLIKLALGQNSTSWQELNRPGGGYQSDAPSPRLSQLTFPVTPSSCRDLANCKLGCLPPLDLRFPIRRIGAIFTKSYTIF